MYLLIRLLPLLKLLLLIIIMIITVCVVLCIIMYILKKCFHFLLFSAWGYCCNVPSSSGNSVVH